MAVKVKFKALNEQAVIPQKALGKATGLDITIQGDYLIYPFANAVKVHTGFAMAVQDGYHAKAFLRSSTGANTKLRLANGTGIIESDYRGEVMLLIENIGRQPVKLFDGERIAQLLIEKTEEVETETVTDLDETERGVGGFGSTGTKEIVKAPVKKKAPFKSQTKIGEEDIK